MEKPLVGIIKRSCFKNIDYRNQKLEYIMNSINVNSVDIYIDYTDISSIINQLNMCDAIIQIDSSDVSAYDKLVYDYIVKKNIPYLGVGSNINIVSSYNKERVEKKKIVFNEEVPVIHTATKRIGHSIDIYGGTLLKDIINKRMIIINTNHKYTIVDEGINTISARALDDVIEAIENPNCDFNIGLQWNPEELYNDNDQMKIFKGLADAAHTYQLKKI